MLHAPSLASPCATQPMSVLITPVGAATPPGPSPAASNMQAQLQPPPVPPKPASAPPGPATTSPTPVVGTAAPAAPALAQPTQPEVLTKRLAWDTLQSEKSSRSRERSTERSGGLNIWARMKAESATPGSLDPEDDKELRELFAVSPAPPASKNAQAKSGAKEAAAAKQGEPKQGTAVAVPYVPVFSVGGATMQRQQQQQQQVPGQSPAIKSTLSAPSSTVQQTSSLNSSLHSSAGNGVFGSGGSGTASATPPPFSPAIPAEEFPTPTPRSYSPSSSSRSAAAAGTQPTAAAGTVTAVSSSAVAATATPAVPAAAAGAGASVPPHRGMRNALASLSPEEASVTISSQSHSANGNGSVSPLSLMALSKQRSTGSDATPQPPPLSLQHASGMLGGSKLHIQTNLSPSSASMRSTSSMMMPSTSVAPTTGAATNAATKPGVPERSVSVSSNGSSRSGSSSSGSGSSTNSTGKPGLKKRRSRKDSLKIPLAAAVAKVRGGEVHLVSSEDEEDLKAAQPGPDGNARGRRTLGEILARMPMEQKPGQNMTPPARRSGAGPEFTSRSEALPVPVVSRPLTPQPRGRTLGLHAEVAIDDDLLPKFAFLDKEGKQSKRMKAATLPLPAGAVSLSPAGHVASATRAGGGSGPNSRAGSPSPSMHSMHGVGSARTPRNMELAALHAHNVSPSPRAALGDHAPRRWAVSPAGVHAHGHGHPDSGSHASTTSTLIASAIVPSAVAGTSSHHLSATSGAPAGLHLNLSSPANGLGLGLGSNRSSAAAAESAYGDSMKSPPSVLSPVVLGSGCLSDVLSSSARVVECMSEVGGVVALDDDALVHLVARHRHAFAQAAQHAEGEFATRLLQRKYNPEEEGLPGTDQFAKLHGNASVDDPLDIVSARSKRVAIPFAPVEWFFSPSNLPLVVAFHLVFAALDWGLAAVPAEPAALTGGVVALPPGTDPAHVEEALLAASRATPQAPYSSLDLARALSTVARANPHAFDAERLTKMDPVRLGSWLQPHIFAQALRDNPRLAAEPHAAETLLASPSSSRSVFPFTYPALEERARVLRELGHGLLRFFNGSATKLVESAEHSASRLVELMTQYFPSFRDQGVYRGRHVMLYTRAQCFARHLWVAFHGHAWGHFADVAELLPRADAQLPAVLHTLGVMRYSRELQGWLERQADLSMMPADVELELRCAAVHGLMRVCQVLSNLDLQVMPVQLDWWLRSHVDPLRIELRPLWPEEDEGLTDDGVGDEHARKEALARAKPVPMPRTHFSTSVWY